MFCKNVLLPTLLRMEVSATVFMIGTASPPEYTLSGGYKTGAAGSFPKGLSSRPLVACCWVFAHSNMLT